MKKTRLGQELIKALKEAVNSTVDKKERRKDLGCSHCPPNKGENSNRKSKHGAKKPKYKDHRK